VQFGIDKSIVVLGFNAQLPECFAAGYTLIRHLGQGTEKKQLSIYLRRETLLKPNYGVEIPFRRLNPVVSP
jgi:hypothetical protein